MAQHQHHHGASSSSAAGNSSSSDAVALHRGLHELEDELRCPICNDFLKVPVSVVNCHHTFCNSCVKAKLRQNLSSLARAATCPQCNEGPLDTRGGEFARCLVPNHTVEAVVQHFQAIRQPLLTTLRQQQQQAGAVIVSNGATAAPNDDACCKKERGGEEEEKSSANSKPRRSTRRTTRASSKDESPSEKEEEGDEESLEEAQDIKHPAIENKNDNNKNDAQQAPPRKKKPRTLYQNFKSKKSLVELCRQEGLSTEGEKEELKTRHAAYIDKYNAECDSRHPRPVAALRRELERDERDKRAARQQPQIQHGASCFEKICAQRELLGKDPHTVWTTVPLSGDEAFDQEMLASFDNLIQTHRKRFPEQGTRRRPWAVVEAAMQEAEAAMPAHHNGKAAAETKPNARKPWSWTQNAKSKQPKAATAVAVPAAAAAASSATNGGNAALPSAAAPTAVHNPYAAASKKRSSTGSTSTTQGGRTTGGGTGLKPAPAVATNPYRSQQNGRLSFSTSAALAPLAASASLEPAPAVATNPYRSQPQQPQGRPFFSDSVPASIAATARAKQGLLGPEEVQVFDRIWGSSAQQQQSLSATASSGSASSLSQQYQSSSTATSGDSASAAASSAPLSATSNAGVLQRNLTPEEDQVRARIFGPSPASQQSSTATTSTVRTLSGSSNENASPAESSSSTNSANGSTNKRKSPRQSKLNLQVVPKKPRPERKKSSPSSTTADNTSSSSLVGPWSCPTCTFHNEKSRSSMAQCEMCRSCRRCGQSKCTCRHSSSSSNGGSSQQSSQQSSASATSAASRETICID